MHRQARVPDAADYPFVIRRPQFRVEASLEEDPAAAVVLEFLKFGGQVVPAQDVAVRGPGGAKEGAEAAAGDADVGVVDVAVDDVTDPGLGVEAPAHQIGGAPQGEEVHVPEAVGCQPVEAPALDQFFQDSLYSVYSVHFVYLVRPRHHAASTTR